MSIAGSSSIRRLKDVAIVMDLHELAPVGWWAPGRRDGWWLERLAQVREDFPDRPRLAGRMSVATGGCKTVAPMPAGSGLLPPADVAFSPAP